MRHGDTYQSDIPQRVSSWDAMDVLCSRLSALAEDQSCLKMAQVCSLDLQRSSELLRLECALDPDQALHEVSFWDLA